MLGVLEMEEAKTQQYTEVSNLVKTRQIGMA